MKYILLVVFVVGSLNKIKKPIKCNYFIIYNLLTNNVEHYFFDKRKIKENLRRIPSDLESFSHKTFYSKKIIELIKLIKEEFIVKKQNIEPKILNISELTPLYAENEIDPPKNLPLWFHVNTCFFQK